jgi:hypothetical protein
MKSNTWEILKASRSECNESAGREMEGCLADEGYVIAYFPTESAMRHADLIAAAPEMLAHLEMLVFGIVEGIPIPKDGAAITAARETIRKARGDA